MTMTPEEKKMQAAREAAFRAAIAAVCAEFKAEITVTEDSSMYGMSMGVMRVDMDGIYTPEGETIQPWVSFEW